MTINLQIAVPNVAALLPTYDVIRVFRSQTTRDGPFVEVTGAASAAASLTGSVVGPFVDLNGKTLILRVTTAAGVMPDIPVSFVAANPVAAATAAAAITAAAPGVLVGSVVGPGQVAITTVLTGQDVMLEVVGGSGLSDLGLGLYARDQGEAPFIPLVAADTLYRFRDPQGRPTDWYRWQFYNTGSLASSAVTSAIQAQEPIVDPVHRIEDFRATRGLTLVRGRDHVFRMSFWEDQAAGLPLTPFDANRYPSYQIVDPNGQVIQSGLAEVDGTTPNYRVPFTVPVDALLTTDDRRWRLDWFLLTDLQRTVQANEIFDVRDQDVTESEIKDQRYLALEGAAKRMRIALPKRPVSIVMQVEEANNPTTTLLPLPAVFPPGGPNPSITELQDGDRYVYYFDVPAGLMVAGNNGGVYQAIWTVLQTPVSEEDHLFQIIDVPPRQIMQMFASLRMAIDKFQIQRNLLQAYQDSDIYEYLRQGLYWVNGIDPIHLQWNMTGVPVVIHPYWLLASMIWGLNAQNLLEVNLAFSSSGQTISLDYDHTAGLDGAISRANELLNSGIKAAKKQLFRKSSSVGSYAGRAMRRTGANNFVFPISHDRGAPSGAANSFLGLLTQVGLI